MAELNLAHYAVKERWTLLEGEPRWEALIREYLETLARRCDETGSCVIGHIKALALFSQGGYLRVSVVSPTLPGGIDSHQSEPCRELVLSLNVIVYGVTDHFLEQMTRDTAAQLCRKYAGEISIEPV